MTRPAATPSVSASRRTRDSRKGRSALALETLGDRTLMAAALTASLNVSDGVLRIEGTYGADRIHVWHAMGAIRIDGVAISVTDGESTAARTSVPRGQVTRIEVAALDGNDVVEMHDTLQYREAAIPLVIHGGAGSDTLVGGQAVDRIFGESGVDSIRGAEGNDILYGDSDPAAAQLARDNHLRIDTAANNYLGKNEKWLQTTYDYPGSYDEYYITPEGELHYYATFTPPNSYTVNDRLVATLDPSYYQDIRKLETERGLFDYNLYLGYGNRDEKWVLGDGDPMSDGWLFITPNGEVYRWDGKQEGIENGVPITGTHIATLDFSYYADPRELVAAATDDAAADVVSGRTGHDLVDGGAGNDYLTGDAGHDDLRGQDGDDTLIGWSGNDWLYGGGGHDRLDGQYGNDNLLGGEGNDRVSGGPDNDWVYGEGGNDSLFGEAGADDLKGGDNNDTIFGGADNDWVYGDAGNDHLYGELGIDNVFGGDDHDQIFGGGDNDWLYGDRGDDLVAGEGGQDNVRGGDHADNLSGGDGNDWIYGGEGSDLMFGQNGSDFMTGEGGDDLIDGGWAGSTPEIGEMSDVLFGGDGNDRMFGGEGSDNLTGDSGADTLMGETGADILDGGLLGFAPEIGAANDFLDGGPGSDRMWGGEGDDTMIGGRGQDTLNGESGQDLLDGGLLGAESEGVFLINDLLDGGEGNDRIWGGEGSDTLVGGSGNDSLNGELGGDLLDGGLFGSASEGAGADRLDGGEGNDTVFGGEGDDTLRGAGGNDRLVGEIGNDVLYGGAGRDTLDGGFGQDGLFGGTQDPRDDLFGGPDADRILSADDNDRDRAPEDALLHFISDGSKNFTDQEIELLDQGFAWLQAVRGNPALLKLQDGRAITFERVLQFDSPNTMADNDSNGKIRIADWCFQAAIPADATIVHEIGHNWDDEMGDFFENEWLPLSGWEPDGIGASGKEESLDGEWLYNFDAPFSRQYGKTNPREDWCTAWEAYYVDSAYPVLFGAPPPPARNNYIYSGMEAKFAVLDRFFAGNF